jgi:hypothetical protein
VRFSTLKVSFYKIGYTTKSSVRDRFSYSGDGDEKLIDREFFLKLRDDAWDIEQSLLDYFGKYRGSGKYSNDPTMPLRAADNLSCFDAMCWA